VIGVTSHGTRSKTIDSSRAKEPVLMEQLEDFQQVMARQFLEQRQESKEMLNDMEMRLIALFQRALGSQMGTNNISQSPSRQMEAAGFSDEDVGQEVKELDIEDENVTYSSLLERNSPVARAVSREGDEVHERFRNPDFQGRRVEDASRMPIFDSGRDMLATNAIISHIRGLNAKEPQPWSGYDKEKYRIFKRDFDLYLQRGGTLPLRAFIMPNLLTIIASRSLLDVEDLHQCSNERLHKCILKQFASSTPMETRRRLENLKMRGSSLIDFENYVLQFEFEASLCEDQPISTKFVPKQFIDGLKPDAVRSLLEAQRPSTLRAAIILARDQINYLQQLSITSAAYGRKLDFGDSNSANSMKPYKSEYRSDSGPVHRDLSTYRCFKCNRLGHLTENCHTKPESYLSREQGMMLQKRKQEEKASSSRNMSHSISSSAPTVATPPRPPGKSNGGPPKPKIAKVEVEESRISEAVATHSDAIPEMDAKVIEVDLKNEHFELKTTLHQMEITPEITTAHVDGELSGFPDPEMKTTVSGRVLLDSGSTGDFISTDIFNRLPLESRDLFASVDIQIRLADKSPPKSIHTVKGPVYVRLRVNDTAICIRVDVVVHDISEDIILGLASMKKYDLFQLLCNPESYQLNDVIDEECIEEDIESFPSLSLSGGSAQTNLQELISADYPRKDALLSILRKHSELWDPLTPSNFIKVDPIVLNLKPGATFKKFHPRRLNPTYYSALRVELDTLLDLGIIYPISSPMASPIVIVPKPNGDIRLCVDYKVWINTILEDVRYPLPYISDILGGLHGKKYFFKLDLTRGFHQLLVDPQSQYLTSFISPFGTFAFTRLPFGINLAPMVFQKVIKEILEPVAPYVCGNLIDDIVGGADSCQDFESAIDAVLGQLKEAGVRLSPSKCLIGAAQMEVLGYVANSSGISMSQKRQEAIQAIPTPTSVKLLRRFLGTTNYFKRFVSGYAVLVKPLTDVTHTFCWGSSQETAFRAIKDAISNTGCLYHIDYSLPLILRVDASLLGVGGVLLNVLPTGHEHIITFLSHAFSGPSKRWSVLEQEAFAAVYCMLELEPVLMGIHFILQTDHRNLVWLYKATAPKLVRWRLRVQAFDFTIHHIPGDSNTAADLLSRVERSEVVTLASILCGGVVVTDTVADIFAKFHNHIVGHKGLSATLRLLRSAGYEWTSMSEDIRHFISSCASCQKRRKAEDARSPPMLHRKTLEPFACIAMDSVGPLPATDDGHRFIQACIDEFSKVVFLFATKSTSAQEAVACLNAITGRAGVVQEIMSDRGSQYINSVMEEYCRFWGIRHRTSLPYRPQANGIIERANQEILRHLKAIVYATRVINQWYIYLPLIERLINSTYHSSIGTAPFRLLYGDTVTLDRGLLTAWTAADVVDDALAAVPVSAYISQLTSQLEDIAEASRQHQSAHLARRRQADPHAVPRIFVEGDFVLVSYPSRPPSKLSPRWRGPFLILERQNNTYVCQDILTNSTLTFDASRLVQWEESAVPLALRDEARKAAALHDRDEFVVESIVSHRGNPKRKSTMEFLIHWLGYSSDEDSWIPYAEAKDLLALDEYLVSQPQLKI
jgi:reverse transcriptase-like protein/integrase-like protein/chromodomain-containing protein